MSSPLARSNDRRHILLGLKVSAYGLAPLKTHATPVGFLNYFQQFFVMLISLTIPGFGLRGLSTKDAIISILGSQWPLSVKDIFQIAKKEYGITVTYQAFHKMLIELEGKKVVVRTPAGFSLNPQWIEDIKYFSDQLSKTYSRDPAVANFQNKDIVNLHFESLISSIRFIIHHFHGDFQNPQKKPRICLLEHPWLPVGANETDWERIKEIFRVPYFGLYRGNTPLDKFGNKITANLGKKSLNGIDYPADGDLVLEGDYVAQLFYPRELKNKLAEIFESSSTLENIDQFDMGIAYDLYTGNYPVKIVISKNVFLANSLRIEAIKLYEKHNDTHGQIGSVSIKKVKAIKS